MRQEVRLKCEKCGQKFTEYIELPMRAEAAIARMKGWNTCPKCGSHKINMTGGVFKTPDSVAAGTKVRQGSIRGQILSLLEEKGPMKVKELRQFIPFSYKSISTKAGELRKMGLAERRPDGYWRISV